MRLAGYLVTIVLFCLNFGVGVEAFQCQRAKGLTSWTPSKMPSWRAATNANFNIKSKLKPMSLFMSSGVEVKMPALSSTMKEGKIVSWQKKVGEKVNSGDVLLVVESDKADMDVESFDEGYLAQILTPAGESAPVGSVVAHLVDSQAAVSSFSGSSSSYSSSSSSKQSQAPAAEPEAPPQFATVHAAPAAAASPYALPEGCAVIKMPALSSTMKEGKIVSWSKKIGDKVSPNDNLLVVESDKADMDVESFDEGYLASICVNAGASAAIGQPVGVLAPTKEQCASVAATVASALSAGVDLSALAAGGGGAVPASAGAQSAHVPSANIPVSIHQESSSSTVRPLISGYARSLAQSSNIDPRSIATTRADGTIHAAEVLSAASAQKSGTAAPLPQQLQQSQHKPGAGVVNISPSARKVAAELGLDVATLTRSITGTGNFNRITEDDVLIYAGKKQPKHAATAAPVLHTSPQQSAPAVAASGPAPAVAAKPGAAPAVEMGDRIVPMDGMQKAVAKNMELSLTVPVFRVSREINTDKLDELYLSLKAKGVTMSSLLAKAVAMCVAKHPLINAEYVVDPTSKAPSIKYKKDVNVAMAVAVDGGLITPTLVGAQNMDLFEMSRKWKDLVDRAKSKKLTPAEYSSGSITISNLGMFGVAHFDAILPPHQGTILAISAANPRVVNLKSGYFGVSKVMTVSATCDHRHIYGAHVAEFLKDLATLLEENVQSLTMG